MQLSDFRNSGEIQLSWSDSTAEDLDRHRAQLERLRRKRERAWVRFDAAFAETHVWLNCAEHTFSDSERREDIRNGLHRWLMPAHTGFDRFYLLAQENVETPCYDITDHIQRCLAGDLSIADRLRGRTVFRLCQAAMRSAKYDLLSEAGVGNFTQQVLKRYTDELADFLVDVVIGFCCPLPNFLSPLRPHTLSIPWTPALIPHFQTRSTGIALLGLLPLVFYETYDSATVRSRFWSELTQQFAKVCIGGVRQFCHQRNLQFALEVPASVQTLEIDVGTILEQADRPILSTDAINIPKRFLIAKWIASRARSEYTQQVSICRPQVASHELRAYESVLGFNSWMVSCKHQEGISTPQSQHLNRFLSIGVPKRQVLIVSPIHSLWTKPDQQTWDELIQAWEWLCQTVWELGYDFDIASETELVAAKTDKKARSIQVKGTAYPLVVLPSCLSLQETTVESLTQFVKGRGKLIAVHPVPYLLNGRIGIDPYPLERLLYYRRTSIVRGTPTEKVDVLERHLKKWIKPVIQVYVTPENHPATTIHIHHRQSKESDLFYLFNSSEAAIETLIEIHGETTQVEEGNTKTGEQSVLAHWYANGNTYITSSFDRQQGRLIVARKKGLT